MFVVEKWKLTYFKPFHSLTCSAHVERSDTHGWPCISCFDAARCTVTSRAAAVIETAGMRCASSAAAPGLESSVGGFYFLKLNNHVIP